jgi:hypothetical protein
MRGIIHAPLLLLKTGVIVKPDPMQSKDMLHAMPTAIYALNRFNVSNGDEYMAYSRRSAMEVQAHGRAAC